MSNIASSPYLDLYFKFQKSFKPVKSYSNQQDIVKDAMRVLSDNLTKDVTEETKVFGDKIKLVYPNYFTEIDGSYAPITDNLVMFMGNDDPNNTDLGKRVLQHMSYYLIPENDIPIKNNEFIRISKSLIYSDNSEVSSFFIGKNESKYSLRVFINNRWDNDQPIVEISDKYSNNINDELVKGCFNKCNVSKNIYTYNLHDERIRSIQEKLVSGDFISAKTFYNAFSDPLSAHLVMLDKASLLYVYSQTTQIGRNNNMGYGGLFVLLSPNVDDNEIEDYRKFFQLISDYISICVAHNIMVYKITEEAEKSAKSAIMSRNMSHNLGSHVMAYLKHHLGSVNNILQNNILANFGLYYLTILSDDTDRPQKKLVLCQENLEEWLKDKDNREWPKLSIKHDIFDSADQLALPFLTGLGHFISYLQERQDFIATISTDYIPYNANVNFKDFVYDELDIDKRYESDEYSHNITIDNILLGNIARSEGLGRKISSTQKGNLCDIVLSFGSFSEDFSSTDYSEISTKSGLFDRMGEIEVSIPGGVIGRQAFFSIFENIIRNAAKHGSWRTEGNLFFRLDIFSKSEWQNYGDNKSLKQIKEACDNVDNDSLTLDEVLQNFYFPAGESDDFYYLIITDNLNYDKSVIRDLRKAITDPYIKDNSRKMVEGNKGIKEIRISASWLRFVQNDIALFPKMLEGKEADDKLWKWRINVNSRVPVVYARLSKELDWSGTPIKNRLQYIFCMSKPKIVALLSSRLSDYNDKDIEEAGWKVFKNLEDFIKYKNKGFEFILFDDNDKNFLKDYSPYSSVKDYLRVISSNRFYTLKELSIDNMIEEIKKVDHVFCPDSWLKLIYKKITNYDSTVDVISIHDGIVSGVEKEAEKQIIISQGGAVSKYLYRTHHEELPEFRIFMNNRENVFDKCEFVEGISGNNSTDRLIRNGKLDSLWFFRHLHAMKTQIAIFDERLFSNIFSIEESDITLGKVQTYINTKFEDILDEVNKKFPEDRETWALQDSNTIISTIRKLHPSFFEKEDVETLTRTGITLRQKGVHVFNIIAEVSNSKVFYIYGLYHTSDGSDFSMNEKYFKLDITPLNEGAFAHCTRLAKITWNQNPVPGSPHLVIEPVSNEIGRFDLISIHQGILDKLYGAFGIKEPLLKETLTKDFYEFFAKEKKTITYDSGPRFYLPGFSIHSGRSRPGKDDMPQKIPFILLSAIENALFDCKFSLVNLLDYARYELQ